VLISYKRAPWPECEQTIPTVRDRHLSAKLVPTLADRMCHVFSATDTHGCVLSFLDGNSYYFLHAAPQLYSRG
jgi:hypothetical protein